MFAKTATGLNCDELFRLPCIPNTPRCRDGRPAAECPYLENGASTDPGKMVSQHQNVQVHHGLVLTELFQMSMNRLVPISRYRLHEIKASLVMLSVIHRFEHCAHQNMNKSNRISHENDSFN